ncbi:MAG: hypothetical protein ACI9U2_000619 [Bradymonadia bacterium]|jgi:hypothetical protein
MAHRNSTPDRLAECLGTVLLPLAQTRRSPIERVRLAWTNILGATLARHAEPLGFTPHGYLIIGARGADWREALYAQRAPIRRRLRAVLETSRGFQLRTIERAPKAERLPAPPPVPLDPRTADIDDSGLRQALSSLLAARDKEHK